MLPFKLVCAPNFYLPIGQSVFPVSKYRLIAKHLLEQGIASPEDFLEAAAASDEDILLVHTREYVEKLRTGALSESELWQLEVPYSRELVEAYWLCTGGTILASQRALEAGVAFNIGGGFHHAFPDHGEGFNLIHDVAVAIRRMQKDGKSRTAMTVDCDVHHGNGTAAIFGAQDAPVSARLGPARPRLALPYMRESPARDVFTLLLHQENNYPAWKPPSSIDVGLPDGTQDDEYLAWLEKALDTGLRRFQPDSKGRNELAVRAVLVHHVHATGIEGNLQTVGGDLRVARCDLAVGHIRIGAIRQSENVDISASVVDNRSGQGCSLR
jgi:acetoin utilization deacetylase AcuC-like enzyme